MADDGGATSVLESRKFADGNERVADVFQLQISQYADCVYGASRALYR